MKRTVGFVVAVVLVVAVPLLPGVIATGSPAALIRIPVESIVAVVLISLLPWRPPRIVVALVYGAFVVAALVLAGLDAAFEYALDIHFDPSDWPQVGDGFGVVQDSIGTPLAVIVLILLAVVAAATLAALAWAALRIDAAIRRHRVRGRAVTSIVTAAWIVAALAGSQLVAGQPAAAAATLDAITSATGRASSTLAEQKDLPGQIRTDPYSRVPSSQLLASLKGKDVVLAFVESYGQVAVQGTDFSSGVDGVLQQSQTQLDAAGYSSQSAWLTSPTFGGLSWLAHSTLQSGIWTDRATVYSQLIRSTRFTLSDAFKKAGWHTVSDVPSDTVPWSFGTSFYHYDTLYDANNVGYRGPRFGYARIPDQYTWQDFASRELTGTHQPVMAEIDLVSSHTPWAPLPRIVPPGQVGDGSIYDPQPAQGRTSQEIFQDPKLVQQAYGQSIQYSLQAMFSFLETSTDPDLVVIELGDHQPATVVSGRGANHQVPITIISKDPTVFDSIASWHWVDGLKPTSAAPIWRMDAFRDRFLSAFDGR